jgi:hypothetical protein
MPAGVGNTLEIMNLNAGKGSGPRQLAGWELVIKRIFSGHYTVCSQLQM